ncbi:unnamed protein product [Linum tenue]|uniref:Uncharacterized protein n=1 Tax=Linum tenue TaxID=586396 RepID=A0AAV0LUM6_9ROSI|nr:unnamed protein product [Linum tenue]
MTPAIAVLGRITSRSSSTKLPRFPLIDSFLLTMAN